MEMPFTTGEFLQVFADYNRAIWPAQVAAYVLGVAGAAAVLSGWRWSGRLVAALLAALWLWTGVAYHILHFSAINSAAYAFGGLFALQAGLFAAAAFRGTLSFGRPPAAGLAAGGLLVAYATVIYPLLGTLAGHGWPRAPMFGVAPCPTTIFTFGLLLWTRRKVPGHLLAIPLLWSLIGVSAALNLGVYKDLGLVFAGVGGTLWIVLRDRAREKARAEPGGRA